MMRLPKPDGKNAASPSRRGFFGAVAGAAAAAGLTARGADAQIVLENEWEQHFPPPPRVYERLDQGIYERIIPEADRFGNVRFVTSPSDEYVHNPGMGYQGYSYEEKGTPQIPGETEAESIRKLIELPFVSQVYMRTDWRVVQQKPGELNLPEMWKYSIELAKKLNKTISFRIQLATTRGYPTPSIPDFLVEKTGGVMPAQNRMMLPHYDHPEFQAAFRDLNRMLADLYDKDPAVECIDLMGYGAWGEWWHPVGFDVFPTPLAASRTLCDMVEEQMDAWRHTPLIMGAHGGSPEIRLRDVIVLALRGGCWFRRDNVITHLHSSDAWMLVHRPPWVAAIIEDGRFRDHSLENAAQLEDSSGEHIRTHIMLKALDLNGNYFALWQHAENILKFQERYARGFDELHAGLGYRVRPSWVYAEEKTDPQALIIAIKNDGCAPPPGILRVYVSDEKGTFKIGGGLDPGLPGPAEHRQCRIVLPLGVKWEGLRLSAELEIKGTRRSVHWACRQALNADGSITMRETPGIGG